MQATGVNRSRGSAKHHGARIPIPGPIGDDTSVPRVDLISVVDSRGDLPFGEVRRSDAEGEPCTNSIDFADWQIHCAFLMVPAQATVAKMLETFKGARHETEVSEDGGQES